MINVPPNSRMSPFIRLRFKCVPTASVKGGKHSEYEYCPAGESKTSDALDFDASCSTADARDESYRLGKNFHSPSPSKPDSVDGDRSTLACRNPNRCLKVRTQRDSLARIAGVHVTPSRQHTASLQTDELPPVVDRKKVRYGTVEFREYERRLSDNPSTSAGPPIGIGWRHNPQDTIVVDLDLYECDREGSRRTKRELAIPPGMREDMLREVGYSRNEIKLAAKKARKDKKRRFASCNQQSLDPLMEKVEVVKDGVKRIIPRRRSTVSLVQ